MTIVSFIRCIRNCASLLNSRPIAILPPTLADPDELLTCSPNSLRGPASATWSALGVGRDYSVQQALIAAQLTRFSKYYKLFYSQKLVSNANMATQSALEVGDVVLVSDLASNSGRSNPHPALGKITSFLDEEHGQAVVTMGKRGIVNKPVGKLVRLVKKNKLIKNQGKSL